MRILAVDPGYERCGVAVLEKKNGKDVLLFSTCLRTNAKDPFHTRLYTLGAAFKELLTEYKPDHFAIEKLYFNTNQKTATNVSEVRGALIFSAREAGCDVFEYTPAQIKSAITGSGTADKKQVMSMIPHLVTIQKQVRLDDEWDAIGIGLTHSACVR